MSNNKFMFIEGVPVEVLKVAQEREKQTSAIGLNTIVRTDRPTVIEIRRRIKDKDYFEVTLPDDYQTKVNMRFGKILWNYTDELYTARISLVEDIYDSVQHISVFDCLEPELTNTRLQSAKTAAYVTALENILIAKNILTPSDLEIIRRSTDRLQKIKMKELYRVEDVFKYWEF